jgi:hypothetical protein
MARRSLISRQVVEHRKDEGDDLKSQNQTAMKVPNLWIKPLPKVVATGLESSLPSVQNKNQMALAEKLYLGLWRTDRNKWPPECGTSCEPQAMEGNSYANQDGRNFPWAPTTVY